MSIVVRIDGLQELSKRLADSPKLVTDNLSTAINKTILTIQSKSLREAPVKTGTLRQGIRARMETKLRGVVDNGVKYALYVHEGTKPHLIRPVSTKGLANRRTGQFFGKLVHHPGTKRNPFFLRGIESSATAIKRFFDDALDAVVKGLA